MKHIAPAMKGMVKRLLNDHVKKLISRNPGDRDLMHYYQAVFCNWKEIVGSQFYNITTPIVMKRIRNYNQETQIILHVLVSDSSAATLLEYNKYHIVQKINLYADLSFEYHLHDIMIIQSTI